MIVYKLSSGEQKDRRPCRRVGLMGSVSALYLARLRSSRQRIHRIHRARKASPAQDEPTSIG